LITLYYPKRDRGGYMTKEKPTTPDEGAGEKQKVVVNGREFDSYQEAAEKMAGSVRDTQQKLTATAQEAADLQKQLDEIEEEKRLAVEKAKEEKPEEEEEEEIEDWEKKIVDRIDKRFAKKIQKIEAAMEKKITDKEAEREKISLTEAQKKKIEDAQKEIATAQGLIPELKDEKSLPFKKVAAWLSLDPEAKDITEELQKESPEAVRRAMGNRVLLAHYYVLHLDGTLGDYLEKEARGSRGVSTLGGSSKVPPKSEMTNEEFWKLSPKEQDEAMLAEMKKKRERK